MSKNCPLKTMDEEDLRHHLQETHGVKYALGGCDDIDFLRRKHEQDHDWMRHHPSQTLYVEHHEHESTRQV